MSIKAEFFACRRRASAKASFLGLVAAVLAGCTLPSPPANIQPAAPVPALAASSPGANGAIDANDAIGAIGTSAAASAPTASAAPALDKDAPLRVLAYFDRIRSQSTAELNQEIARLGTPHVPANQLQLALALGQLRQTTELVRAQELLTRLLANPDLEAQVLHPLARLLAARFSEQRRLEDLLDKQAQQTRDLQRRLDQTNERLEALKAIERSLTSRPPVPVPAVPATPPASAPISRSRSSAP